ncbi:hypothetical protein [Chryseobacterium sp. SIMBA_029]|uniref:hypothetical protein n=1 Tax=Chryseobacterium sp. SIMBA_029 TaxID=3085772 RepID=UPI00397B6621
MNLFFKSIGLYDRSILNIEIDKSVLAEKLKKITYTTNLNFSLISDSTIPTRFEYRGQISNTHFMIRRRKRIFDINIINAIINGTFSEEIGNTSITLEITPSLYHTLPFIVTIIFCFLFVFTFINEKHIEIIWPLTIAVITNVGYYFALKNNIKRNKYDFERELNFIVQKNNY